MWTERLPEHFQSLGELIAGHLTRRSGAKRNAQYLGVENPLDLAICSSSIFTSRDPGAAVGPTPIKIPKTTR
jgi:hypothetical protein